MKRSIRSLFLILVFMICTQAYAESFLSDAERYAVRVKSSISYPFAEDEAGTFNGAGFLIAIKPLSEVVPKAGSAHEPDRLRRFHALRSRVGRSGQPACRAPSPGQVIRF